MPYYAVKPIPKKNCFKVLGVADSISALKYILKVQGIKKALVLKGLKVVEAG